MPQILRITETSNHRKRKVTGLFPAAAPILYSIMYAPPHRRKKYRQFFVDFAESFLYFTQIYRGFETVPSPYSMAADGQLLMQAIQ